MLGRQPVPGLGPPRPGVAPPGGGPAPPGAGPAPPGASPAPALARAPLLGVGACASVLVCKCVCEVWRLTGIDNFQLQHILIFYFV